MARVIEADYPPLTLDQGVALRAYARAHGRSWKTKLLGGVDERDR